MKLYRYTKYILSHDELNKPIFERLNDIFKQLLLVSSGDISQALQWLTDLDKEYDLTADNDYSIAQFIQELQDRGFIRFDESELTFIPTAAMELSIRKQAFNDLFKKLKKGNLGQHTTHFTGKGLDRQAETRPYQFGDNLSNLDSTGTILNAYKRSSPDAFNLRDEDLNVHETDHHTGMATVLLIDLSHSMILYGEDRITPAKKVALALSEFILTQFSKDSLDIIAFGNEAWEVTIKDLPYLKVGPFHTNTKAALERARHLLQRRKFKNKQIFMITDGKPSAMFEKGKLYKNSFGLDRKIVNKVLDEAVKCRKEKISITTFMIARDPYLMQFVKQLSDANKGRAYYTGLNNLGELIMEDYLSNRTKKW